MTRSISRRRFLALGGAGALAVAGGGYAVESNALDVTHPASPASAATDDPRPPLRIALVTDVHGRRNHVAMPDMARAVRAFDPHLLLVVGDAVNGRGEEPLVRAYGEFPARLAKLATLGNWEHVGNCDMARLRREYERAGTRLLVNETATVDFEGEPLELVGLDDWRTAHPDYRLVEAPPGAGRRLVLSHCPITFDTIADVAPRPVHVFSGHTHGGQVAPFGMVLVTPKGSGRYVQGWYERTAPGASTGPAHRMYVSRGIGWSEVPFRIGARPELALITL